MKLLVVLAALVAIVSATHEPVQFWAQLRPITGGTSKGLCNGRYVEATSGVPRNLKIYCVHDIADGSVASAHLHGPSGPNGQVPSPVHTLTVPDMAAGALDQNPIFGGANFAAGLVLANEDQERTLFAGMYYVVIHTAAYPNGALRGQLWPFGHPSAPATAPTHTAFANDVQSANSGINTSPANFTRCAIAHYRRQATTTNTEWVWSGIVGGPTAAHNHGPISAPNQNVGVADVLCASVGACAAKWQSLTGTDTTLTNADYDNGNVYLNVHSAAWANGEVRGQVTKPVMINRFYGDDAFNFFAAMNGPNSALGYMLAYYETGTRTLRAYIAHNAAGTTAAHFHGPADLGDNQPGSVVLDFGTVTGQNFISATWSPLTNIQEGWLYAGSLYVNVHTTAQPVSAVRGQVYKWDHSSAPTAAALVNVRQVGAGGAEVAGQGGISWFTGTTTVVSSSIVASNTVIGQAHVHDDAPSTPASLPGTGNPVDFYCGGGGQPACPASPITLTAIPHTIVSTGFTPGLKYSAWHNGGGSVVLRGQIRAPAAPAPQRWSQNADAAQFYANLANTATAAANGGNGACAAWYSKAYKTLRISCATSCPGVTSAHIHGPIADAEAIGTDHAVWNGLAMVGTNDKQWVGSWTVQTAEEAQFLNDRFYVNFHSAAEPNGCSRGQLYRAGRAGKTSSIAGPTHIAVLDDKQEGKGPTATDPLQSDSRAGVALVWNNNMGVAGSVRTQQTWSGLSGAATAGHIHGPAGAGTFFTPSAGVVWGLTVTGILGSTADTFPAGTGAQATGNTDLASVAFATQGPGSYYFNVHTPANGGGEIRGQISPLVCYPYTSMCPTAFSESSSSSSSSSSTGPGGAASTVVVSFGLIAVLAAVAALFQ
jgi:hypothetical protein